MPKIMIIDEEETTRDLLSVYSEMLGYDPVVSEKLTVCCNDNSTECLCVKEDACADVVLVNQRCFGMTGLDFIQERINKSCKVPIHKIAILSGRLSSEEFMQAKLMGCHCLQKPVSFEILENWLSQFEAPIEMIDKAKFN